MNYKSVMRSMGYILLPVSLVQSIVIVSILQIIALPMWIEYEDVFREMPSWVFNYVEIMILYGGLFVIVLNIILVMNFFMSGNKKGSHNFSRVSKN